MNTNRSDDDARLLLDSVVDYAIFWLDRGGRVASWNRGAEKIKGYTAGEILGQHVSVFFPREDIASGQCEREQELARAHGRAEHEGWRIRKDGARFWANVVTTALYDEGGELRGFGNVTRDLTQRRESEDGLRRAEERFHHLVDAVTDYAIFMLDSDGRVATWNPGAQRAKGYAAEEIIGQNFSAFYTPEDRAAGAPQRILDVVRREGRFEDEGFRVRKDGSRFWANVVVTALRDPGGAVVGFAKVTRDLTDRRLAQEEQRKSEQHFRFLVEGVTDYAIYMLTADGRVATWNAGAERLTGYGADEIVGRDFAVFFPPSAVEAGQPARELEVARAEGRFEEEGWRVRKDGTKLWANVIITAVRDDRQQLRGFAKIIRDLTARRQTEEVERKLLLERAARAAAERAERSLRESEERYRSLSSRLDVILEGVADGITVQDRSGAIVFANSTAARLYGFRSRDELTRASPADAKNLELRDEHGQPFDPDRMPARHIFRGEPPQVVVLQVRNRRSGHEWWARAQAGAVFDAEGKPDLAITIWHEITIERRRERDARCLSDATAALAASLDPEAMLSSFARTLVPRLADCCMICLRKGDQVRPVASEHIANECPSDVLTSARRVIASGRLELLDASIDEASSETAAATSEPASPRSSSRRVWMVTIPIHSVSEVTGALSLAFTQSGRGYGEHDVALVEELARRAGIALTNAHFYQAEREAAMAAEAAARSAAQANQSKDDFLAMASHELRTPLNAIVGWASMLRSQQLAAVVAKGIEVIHRNALVQVKIIEDILDVSRIAAGKLRLEIKATDLAAIIRDAVEVVRPAASAKHIGIGIEAPAQCPLRGDPERLQQVMGNLLSNAIKFTDSGGSVRISIRQEPSSSVLRVSDTGRGIERDLLPLVFERFKQGDSSSTRRVGGLGLGLALVRHIVELHGGSVAAQSDGPGTGATFTIALPNLEQRVDGDEQPLSGAAVAALPRGLLHGVHVLVVDDDSDGRELLCTALKQAGAFVEMASSAAQAFDAFLRFQPQVLLSDISMPDEDGYSLMRRIRRLSGPAGGEVPAIALTAHTRPEDAMHALASGFTAHLGKPVDLQGLLATVAALLKPG